MKIAVMIMIILAVMWIVRTSIRARKNERLLLEEIKRLNKEYPDTDLGSGEKIFDVVTLEQAILTKGEKYLLAECTEEQCRRVTAVNYPLKLGYYCKEGWSGGLPFYLFYCFYCSTLKVSYKQGYGPYLWCDDCERLLAFSDFSGAASLFTPQC